MKRIIILILIFTLTSIFNSNIYSQNIGVYANINQATVHTDRYENESIFTPSIGLEYYGREDKLLKYTLGLSYEQKGEKFENNGYTYIRINYLQFKTLAKIGNSMIEGQFGPYMGFFTSVKHISNGIQDDSFYQYMNRFNYGLTTSVNQYLFSTSNISGYLRGEVNYDISNYYFSDLFTRTNYDRHFNYSLGFLLKWDKN